MQAIASSPALLENCEATPRRSHLLRLLSLAAIASLKAVTDCASTGRR